MTFAYPGDCLEISQKKSFKSCQEDPRKEEEIQETRMKRNKERNKHKVVYSYNLSKMAIKDLNPEPLNSPHN